MSFSAAYDAEVALIVALGSLQLYVLYAVCSLLYQSGKAEIVPM